MCCLPTSDSGCSLKIIAVDGNRVLIAGVGQPAHKLIHSFPGTVIRWWNAVPQLPRNRQHHQPTSFTYLPGAEGFLLKASLTIKAFSLTAWIVRPSCIDHAIIQQHAFITTV